MERGKEPVDTRCAARCRKRNTAIAHIHFGPASSGNGGGQWWDVGGRATSIKGQFSESAASQAP